MKKSFSVMLCMLLFLSFVSASQTNLINLKELSCCSSLGTQTNLVNLVSWIDEIRDLIRDLINENKLRLYFYNTTSSFNSSYTEWNTTIPPGEVMVSSFQSLPTGKNLLAPRIYTKEEIGTLKAGTYKQYTNIEFIAGTKDIQLSSDLLKRLTNGTEVSIVESDPSLSLVLGKKQQVYWWGEIQEDVIFENGEYLVMRLYAQVTGTGSNPDINLIVGGSTGARVDIGF